MNIVMFGPPGAGKGSVSAELTKKLTIPHISTGDIVRAESKRENNKVSKYMEAGQLVPDEIIMEITRDRLTQDDCKEGFILDGFPRTVPQAEFLKTHAVKIDTVLNFEVADDVLVHRLSGRRMDPKTGAIYNVNTLTIPEGVDEESLVQRPDDKEEVIKQRLEVYHKQTAPLVEYYQKEGVMKNINADQALDKVISDSLSVVE